MVSECLRIDMEPPEVRSRRALKLHLDSNLANVTTSQSVSFVVGKVLEVLALTHIERVEKNLTVRSDEVTHVAEELP
jgi:hypothetical protein